jgi:hypothetical protein
MTDKQAIMITDETSLKVLRIIHEIMHKFEWILTGNPDSLVCEPDNDDFISYLHIMTRFDQDPTYSMRKRHEEWLQIKLDEGWKYGEEDDEANMVDTCILPYDEIPYPVRAMDELFETLIKAIYASGKISVVHHDCNGQDTRTLH